MYHRCLGRRADNNNEMQGDRWKQVQILNAVTPGGVGDLLRYFIYIYISYSILCSSSVQTLCRTVVSMYVRVCVCVRDRKESVCVCGYVRLCVCPQFTVSR